MVPRGTYGKKEGPHRNPTVPRDGGAPGTKTNFKKGQGDYFGAPQISLGDHPYMHPGTVFETKRWGDPFTEGAEYVPGEGPGSKIGSLKKKKLSTFTPEKNETRGTRCPAMAGSLGLAKVEYFPLLAWTLWKHRFKHPGFFPKKCNARGRGKRRVS